jgi:hypothetical protein
VDVYLNIFYVSDGVVFSNNKAGWAYDRDAKHDEIYNSHIGNNVIWTYPFTQGYNNYDIKYTEGELIMYEDNVADIDNGTKLDNDTEVDNGSSWAYSNMLLSVVIVCLIVCIITVVSGYRIKKKRKTSNGEKEYE